MGLKFWKIRGMMELPTDITKEEIGNESISGDPETSFGGRQSASHCGKAFKIYIG
jgi:hypothetical protein